MNIHAFLSGTVNDSEMLPDSAGGLPSRRPAHPAVEGDRRAPDLADSVLPFLCTMCGSDTKSCLIFFGSRIFLKSKPKIKMTKYPAWQAGKYDRTLEGKKRFCKIYLILDGF